MTLEPRASGIGWHYRSNRVTSIEIAHVSLNTVNVRIIYVVPGYNSPPGGYTNTSLKAEYRVAKDILCDIVAVSDLALMHVACRPAHLKIYNHPLTNYFLLSLTYALNALNNGYVAISLFTYIMVSSLCSHSVY